MTRQRPVRSLADLASLQERLRDDAAERARLAAEARERAAAEARERELFARSVGPVTPLRRAAQQALLGAPRPAPLPLQRRRDEVEVLREAISDDFDAESLLDTDEGLSFRRRGIGMEVVRKLRRGAWAVQGHLDLHGLRREEARERLAEFIREAARQQWRCVRIVHGKGLGSPGGAPVLKGKVRNWLVQKDEVLAFVQARGNDGGHGALVVLLDDGRRRSRAPAADLSGPSRR